MRVCLICEGSYPYVSGGVSSWVQMLCSECSEIEFVIWSIATTREEMAQHRYTLPENIKEVHTIYLGDYTFGNHYKKVRLLEDEKTALRNLVNGADNKIEWGKILKFIKKHRKHLVDILMGEAFFDICLEAYQRKNSKQVFNDFLWTLRGMYFSTMCSLSGEIPKADIYHTLSTGYAGMLGSSASYIYHKPLVLTEHGIYTREREEDIIRSNWIHGEFKEMWIEYFRKLSAIAYYQADIVTTLFEQNKSLQIELGCPKEKIQIISNGVDVEQFMQLKSQNKVDRACFNIGAVLRVVPIKDVKSMILAFKLVHEQYANTHLHIMGDCEEDREYYEECIELIKALDIENITFYGQVDIKEYLPDMDLLLLSSISEGQPLAILEGMSAKIPYIATNVGSCRELLEGKKGDILGKAGIIVDIMDCEQMAKAITYCIENPQLLHKMGEIGCKRVQTSYQKTTFIQAYKNLYKQLGGI